MPTYRCVTLGCKLNQADSSALDARLASLGMARARPDEPADVVVLNTCTVTAGADREARQLARRLRRENPGAALIATGCYAQRDPAALRALPEIDHVVGLHEALAEVPALAARAAALPGATRAFEPGPFGETGACDPRGEDADRTRAFLKIQDGCDLRCAYCVIPSVRGASRSLAPAIVLHRIERLAGAGFREIVFTGVNTGDYGKDLDPATSLADLLDAAGAGRWHGRLRLNSLEPRTVTREIVARLSEAPRRIARHVQVPLQSGSDRVLARMRRPYRTADYARAVEGLARAVPGIGLGADVIAGFPGETDEEFEETVRFIADSPLAYLHVFPYSPRPGTRAAEMPDPVAAPVVKERAARLRLLGRALSLRFRRSMVGRDLEVLVLLGAGPDGRTRGLSDNFIDMALEAGGRAAERSGSLVMARVTSATDAITTAVVLGA